MQKGKLIYIYIINIIRYYKIFYVLNLGVHFSHCKIILNSEGTCTHKSGSELCPKTQFA